MAAYPKAQYKRFGARTPVRRSGFVVLGAVLLAVGVLSLAFPLLAALSFNLVVGLTLLVGGIAALLHAFRVHGWQGRAVQIVLGLLYMLGGLVFLANPFAGLLALTLALGAFFAADGIARMLMAAQIRPLRGWGLFLVSGLLSLGLGALVLLGLPGGWSLAILGMVVGLNMILTGAAFLCCTGTAPGRVRD
ncbi:MAG: DUF308 domain-containing protein [Erythrobacter sp.]|uniref:HdeD family acid-resistance protein n=1 Tax=Erythrobacter sp. TaxID=1042 RepID=UPI0025F46FF5|nr:DUF308 domain-containing protein [Erythrobacter sp.]MCM0001187.1 DUF308 domain-containing protein [Erythrobacter sp.]